MSNLQCPACSGPDNAECATCKGTSLVSKEVYDSFIANKTILDELFGLKDSLTQKIQEAQSKEELLENINLIINS